MDIQFHSSFRDKKQTNIRTVSKYKLPSGKGEQFDWFRNTKTGPSMLKDCLQMRIIHLTVP